MKTDCCKLTRTEPWSWERVNSSVIEPLQYFWAWSAHHQFQWSSFIVIVERFNWDLEAKWGSTSSEQSHFCCLKQQCHRALIPHVYSFRLYIIPCLSGMINKITLPIWRYIHYDAIPREQAWKQAHKSSMKKKVRITRFGCVGRPCDWPFLRP